MTLEKTYDPAATETRLYDQWEKSGAFACDVNASAKPYTIMMPPPNVTGSLHMGHALTFTLQDVLVRLSAHERQRHAFGSLAQITPALRRRWLSNDSSQQLAITNRTPRHGAARPFLEKVWEWKEESGGTITKQLRRLGRVL